MTNQVIRYCMVLLCISISHIGFAQVSRTPSADASSDQAFVDLMAVDWMHGAPDCETERLETDYAEWQQVRFQVDTYIFRQNKCSNYEAPFVYLFVGAERALSIDTGATIDGGPELVKAIRSITDLPVIAAHSHGHGDHRRGDDALQAADGVTLVGIGADAVQRFFGFENWPESPTTLELGNRSIELLPIPGHLDDDLAFYDPVSRFVITGDTLYPGRLYIGDWLAYRASIARLAGWVESRSVSYVMGTHIEMSNTPNVDYPIGTTYQPEEHHLPLSISDIDALEEAVAPMETAQRTYLGSFIIWPRD